MRKEQGKAPPPQQQETVQVVDEQDEITRLQPGTILDGKYEITGYLGRGGMGSVYRAVHTQLGNEVAIKVLHPRFAQDQVQLSRFQREAQIISGLHHKNILTVRAFSLWEGHAYMAIEFVNGESLREFVNERGPLKVEIAIPMLVQICDAMEFAHKHDVLHRDLKPDNVLVVKTDGAIPDVKVVDFGLAKLVGNEDMQKLTRTGQVVGDPHYMSPEQCQGMELDARSDIYSFGCLMYEVFAGCRAFQSESPVSTMYQHLQSDPAPLAKPLGLPAPLEAIVFRAIELGIAGSNPTCNSMSNVEMWFISMSLKNFLVSICVFLRSRSQRRFCSFWRIVRKSWTTRARTPARSASTGCSRTT